MAYLILAAQLIASFGMLALFSIAAAFQDEGVRWSNTATKALDLTMFGVLFIPAVLALVSLFRELRGRPPVLKLPWWFMTFLVCGFATVGLMAVKEEIAHTARKASEDRHRAELVAATQQGDGAKACELVCLGEGAPVGAFAVCRGYVDQASTAEERLRRLEPFTMGGWLRSWNEGNKVVAVVPAPDQVWFVNAFFGALLEVTPGSSAQRPAASPVFDDLLTAGSALSGVGRPELLTHEALCAIARLVPRIESTYAERLTAATTGNPERATYFRSVLEDARTRAGRCETP